MKCQTRNPIMMVRVGDSQIVKNYKQSLSKTFKKTRNVGRLYRAIFYLGGTFSTIISNVSKYTPKNKFPKSISLSITTNPNPAFPLKQRPRPISHQTKKNILFKAMRLKIRRSLSS